jgi:hypothetical protein
MTKAIINKWEKRLQEERKVRKSYRNRCEKIEKIYSGDVSPYSGNTSEDATYNYNILWINCQIYLAALYSRNPSPDVRRRYKDSVDYNKARQIQDQALAAQAIKSEEERVKRYNDLGKEISILMERALTYTQDNQDFFGNASDAVMSFVKFSMGQARVRYIPVTSEGDYKKITVIKDDNGEFREEESRELVSEDRFESIEMDGEDGYFIQSEEREESLEHEELVLEWVPERNFHWESNVEWKDVSWCVIDHYLTKDELIAQFGEERAGEIPLSYNNQGEIVDARDKNKAEKPTMALVHECFDKRNQKVQIYAKGYDKLLEDMEDPYNLEGFYPFPKPMFGTMGDDNINPIPEYLYYQDQHTELNTITWRIHRLLETIKYRGFYDGSIANVINVSTQEDGEFEPLPDFAKLAAAEGGRLDLNNHFATLPIAEAKALLDNMYIYRDQTVKVIYEITGISDIVRGSSKASETLGAQELKSQYASLRLRPKIQTIERFFRDIMRIEAEFLAEKFELDTLEGMTGMEVTPEMEEILSSDLLRSYIVDVETDSTVIMDSQKEQRERTEALTAMTGMMQQLAPLLQLGAPKELVGQFILFGLKGFKGARELEDVIQGFMDQSQAPKQPDPMQQQAQQMAMKKEQVEIADKAANARKSQAEAEAQQIENDMVSSKVMEMINPRG